MDANEHELRPQSRMNADFASHHERHTLATCALSLRAPGSLFAFIRVHSRLSPWSYLRSSAVGIFHSGELLLALTELDQRVEKLLPTMFVTIEMNKVGGIRNCDQPFDRCMHQVSH
jgi:hypothetical protein